MKFINRYKYIFALTLIFGASACEEGFEEANTDPNSPTAVPPANLVTNAIYNIADDFWGRAFNFEFGELMVQHMAQNEYTSDQNYQLPQADFNGRFSNLYQDMYDLVVARKMIEESELGTAASKANQIAVIDIMIGFTFQMATDMWGDIPYTQAFQSVEFPFPVYDAQSTIYSGIIQSVGTAVNSISTSDPGFATGDILFAGNMARWQEFGNALLIRMGMRISDSDAALAQSTVTAAFGRALPTSDVMFVFDANQALANPFYVDRVPGSRDDFRISGLMVSEMNALTDPRLAMYAEPAPGGTAIVGMPYGLNDANAFAQKNTTSDIHGNIENTATAPAYFFSMAELHFFRAEAIQKGWTVSGTAAGSFNAGIQASMDQWGVAAADATAYLAGISYPMTGMSEIQSIAQQKWFHLYSNGVEAYAEWRRLDFPVLAPGPGAFESSIPTRMLYPVTEDGTNGDNMAAAGANTLSRKVGWDVN